METVLENIRCDIDISLFTDEDISLIKKGEHYCLYEKFGSHVMDLGTNFALWAPNAKEVSVIGDFNEWDEKNNPLKMREDNTGIWEGFVKGVGHGEMYKYSINSSVNNCKIEKRDPFSFYCEEPPKRASIVWDLNSKWKDSKWMRNRIIRNALDSPFSVYEVHFGSWHRFANEGDRYPTYDEMAQGIIRYVKDINRLSSPSPSPQKAASPVRLTRQVGGHCGARRAACRMH